MRSRGSPRSPPSVARGPWSRTGLCPVLDHGRRTTDDGLSYHHLIRDAALEVLVAHQQAFAGGVVGIDLDLPMAAGQAAVGGVGGRVLARAVGVELGAVA